MPGESIAAFLRYTLKYVKLIYMVNLFRTISESDSFRKLEINDLLFVEYTCMREATKFGVWSNNNYFAFIFSGKKIWRSIYNSYEVNEGDIIFVKKGANLTHQFFNDKFCAIFLFIPDDFIKEFLRRHANLIYKPGEHIVGDDSVFRVESNQLLENYMLSLQAFMKLSEKPDENLLRLKFEELLLSIFTTRRHPALTNYFISLCRKDETQMDAIMNQNFAYNLKIENYAELCNMSLSAFKSAFKRNYNTTPAVWLKERRLELACQKILLSNSSINQIAFECGFEDPSHFIRVFKQKHKCTPLQYRLNLSNPASTSLCYEATRSR